MKILASRSVYFELGEIIEKVSGQTYPARSSSIHLQAVRGSQTPMIPFPQLLNLLSVIPSAETPQSSWTGCSALSPPGPRAQTHQFSGLGQRAHQRKSASTTPFKAMITSNGFVTGGASYGFGLGLSTFNNRKIIEHGGAINGFTAYNIVFLDDGFTVVVLINNDSINPGNLAVNILDAVCNSTQLSGNC